MQLPVMPEDGHTTRVTSGEEATSSVAGKDSSVAEPVWDDEDTRAFYECLPDLRFVFLRNLSTHHIEREREGGEKRKNFMFVVYIIGIFIGKD